MTKKTREFDVTIRLTVHATNATAALTLAKKHLKGKLEPAVSVSEEWHAVRTQTAVRKEAVA